MNPVVAFNCSVFWSHIFK